MASFTVTANAPCLSACTELVWLFRINMGSFFSSVKVTAPWGLKPLPCSWMDCPGTRGPVSSRMSVRPEGVVTTVGLPVPL